MSLRLQMQVRDVREASAEEIEARSVSGSPLSVLGSGATASTGPLH